MRELRFSTEESRKGCSEKELFGQKLKRSVREVGAYLEKKPSFQVEGARAKGLGGCTVGGITACRPE